VVQVLAFEEISPCTEFPTGAIQLEADYFRDDDFAEFRAQRATRERLPTHFPAQDAVRVVSPTLAGVDSTRLMLNVIAGNTCKAHKRSPHIFGTGRNTYVAANKRAGRAAGI
jgi:hypothetical protein